MRALKANWLMRSAFRHIMALVTLMAMPGLARAQQGGGKVAAQKEHPKPFTALSTSALSLRDSIVALARAPAIAVVRAPAEPVGADHRTL